jgi:hypothetical protein
MNDTEKRLFPRIQAMCPVLYRLGEDKSWKVARMYNFSATGIQFQCADEPALSTSVSIHVKPGSKKNIPELIAKGSVIRIDKLSEQEFLLSCQLTKVSSS